jgi:hypothetical protein
MRAGLKEYPELDDLLRRALADDLPADVAAGMRERIARFRTDGPGEPAPSDAWAGVFQRGIWTVLSILMLLAGIVLQGSKSPSPLADRISSIMTAYSHFDTTRR